MAGTLPDLALGAAEGMIGRPEMPGNPMPMRPLVTLLLILLSAAACAGQTDVEVAPGVPGRLVLPDGQPPHGAVLLLHGFNSHMDEVGDMYADLAQDLAARGIASLRFDFSGEGPQAHYVVTSTYGSRVREAEQAYALLRARVPKVPMGVQGFSLGGLISMAIAEAHPDWFTVMVLWSAAASMRMDSDPAGAAAVREALATGRSVLHSWTDITLTREFLVSYIGIDVGADLSKYPGSLLTIRGSDDHLPSHDREWLASTPSNDDEFVLIGGADHIYHVLDTPRPDYGARVRRLTTDWFAARL